MAITIMICSLTSYFLQSITLQATFTHFSKTVLRCTVHVKCKTPDFITPDLWPSNNPDLNPVNYRILGVLQECVYRKSVKNVDEL